ncbi:Uncharacterized protein BCZB5J_02775 [Bacillus cereus]|nr:Uncharacterized protein BCZB5J_02775 [Bacillus cereus]
MTAAVICLLTDDSENDIFEWADFLGNEVIKDTANIVCILLVKKRIRV